MGSKEDPGPLREEIDRLRKALSEATLDLASMLRLRGFRIHSRDPDDDLLVPGPMHIDGYYSMMGRYSFRLFLRDVIKHQDRFTPKEVTRYATSVVTAGYVRYLAEAGLVEKSGRAYRLVKRPIKSFGETLEWYVASVLEREFFAEAFRGVKFKGRRAGGDYDIVAKADGRLIYIEVKSSPPKQIYQGEIAGFLDRAEDLNPDLSVFFMDTELRMKDKIVPMFEEELAARHAVPPPVKRIAMELFHISGRMYIINSRHSIVGNIEKAMAFYFRSLGRREA